MLTVEDVLEREGGIEQVPGLVVLHALRHAGRARGVEDEQRVLGVELLRRTVGRGAGHHLVVPDVAAVAPRRLVAGAAHHDARMRVRTGFQRLVGVSLERHVAAAARAFVGGEHHPAVGIENAVAQRVRRESAEHDGVHRADPRAGEHRHRRLGHHRHVDADPVAFLHALGLEHVGELADLGVQLPEGDAPLLARPIPFPEDRRLVAALLQMPVEAVPGDVHPGAVEPPDVDIALEGPVRDLVPLPEPVDMLVRHVRPESVRILDRTPVHGLIRRFVDERPLRRMRQHVVDLGIRHVSSLNPCSRSLNALIESSAFQFGPDMALLNL